MIARSHVLGWRMLVTIAASCLAVTGAGAQRVQKDASGALPDTNWFAVTVGIDTIARERVVRSPARLDGDLRLSKPTPMAVRYTVYLRHDGSVDSLRTTQVRTDVVARAAIDFLSDSAVLTMHAPGLAAPRVDRIAAASGSLPFINLSAGILDLIFRRARVMGGSEVMVPLLAGPQPMEGRVRFIGSDSAVLLLNVELHAKVAPDGALAGAVVPAQNVRFTRLPRPATAWGESDSVVTSRHEAPADAPYLAEEVTIAAPGGVFLAGTLTLPRWASRTHRAPVVVTISGSGPQNRDSEIAGVPGFAIFRQVADTLGRRDVGVLRFDDRGVGASRGSTANATSEDFARDVRAAVAWLRVHPAVDPARIGLLGHSEGAMIAPMIAADDSLIAAVALLAAPARPGHELSAHQRRIAIATNAAVPGTARDSVFAVAQAQSDSLVRAGAAGAWTRFWWTYDPREAAARVRAPVLLLHGETDMQVPVAHAGELAALVRRSGNADVTLHVIPAVNHLFLSDPSGHWDGYGALPSKVVPAVVMGPMADWFAARLAVRSRR